MQTFTTPRCHLRELAFTPDGRRLLVGAQTRLLLDTLGTDPSAELKPPDEWFAAHANLALGGSVLVYLSLNDLRVWNISTGGVATWPGVGKDVRDLTVGPDGATVYAAHMTSTSSYGWRTEILAFDVATGAPKATYAGGESGLGDLKVSADGRRLVAHGSYDACAWDLTRPGDPRAVTLFRVGGLGNYLAGVAASADGTRMATVSSRGLQFWDLEGETVREVFRSGKHKRRVTAVACGPTRPLIATGDAGGTVFLWDHAGRVLNRYDWGLSGEVYALCFAPDGQRCAATDGNGRVVVWDVDV